MLTIFETGRRTFAPPGLGGDVWGLLFALGIGLWTFGLFGAGDAKLFLSIGLFSGCNGMLPFAICSVGRTLF
jgi:prepilin peptidase CpaA